MRCLVDQRREAKHMREMINALAPGLEMFLPRADPLARPRVVIVLSPLDVQRALARQHRSHKVHGNVLAVENVGDVVPDLPHLGVVRGVEVHDGYVHKRQVGEDDGVLFRSCDLAFHSVLLAEFVPPASLWLPCSAPWRASHYAALPVFPPCVEHKIEILGVVVNVVVLMENGLGSVLLIGQKAHVQALVWWLAIPHTDPVLGDIVTRWCRVDVDPDNHNLVQSLDRHVKERF